MKNIKKVIASALIATAFAATSVGTTFALFTDEEKATITVQSGIVDVDQQIVITSKTSALADPAGTILDENGARYTTQPGWVNGGDAEVTAGGDLSLHEMTPGDFVGFKVQMKNNSNVKIKYRLLIEANGTSSLLASGLQFGIGGTLYDGLLSYKSEWTLVEPSAAPAFVDLLTGSIYLPLTRDNVFQNLSTSYKVSLQAVQGNAAVSSGSSYECASYLPQTAELDTNKKATIEYREDPQATDADVIVELDLSDNTSYQAGQEVLLAVNTVDVVENASSFRVKTEGNEAAAAIDLNLFIDNTQVTSGFLAKIKTKVAAGLQNIKIEYDGTDVAFADGGHIKESEESVLAAGDFYYKAATGDLVFMTDHFSDYLVTADNIVAYNKTSKVSYTSLQGAIEAATAGDTIVLLKDLSLPRLDANRNVAVDVTKSLVIDGRNHVITTTAGRGLWVSVSNVKVEVRNLEIKGTAEKGSNNLERGFQVNNDVESVEFVLLNCRSTALMYTVNVCTSTDVKLVIDGCYFKGWAAVNLWCSDSEIEITNSTLIGVNYTNDKKYAFYAICLEGDPSNHAENDIVTVTNCSIYALDAEDDRQNKQCIVGFNSPSTNNAVSFEKCIFEVGENIGQFDISSGTGNSLSVKDCTINGDVFDKLCFDYYPNTTFIVNEVTITVYTSEFYASYSEAVEAIYALDDSYTYVRLFVNGSDQYYFLYI